jgi:hypothetical protein
MSAMDPSEAASAKAKRLRSLLTAMKTEKPYKDGETVYLYCGKACKYVKHTVLRYGDSAPFALCDHPGCSRAAPLLPKRYQETEVNVAYAALAALPDLLDALDDLTARAEEDR